jgi:hypothetical protein
MFFETQGLEEILDQEKLPAGFIGGLPVAVKLLIYILALSELFPAIVGFYSAAALFKAFGRGEVFTQKAAQRVGLIGWVVVAIPLASNIFAIMIAGILAAFKTAGEVSIIVDFDEGDMMAVVFGLLVVILGKVMVEAIKISDENRQFV